MSRVTQVLAAGASALAATLSASAGGSFQILSQGVANGVSADGTVVVGQNNEGAFRWRFDGGFTYLDGTTAIAANHDGSIVAGNTTVGATEVALRSVGDVGTPLGGIEATGCDFYLSSAYAISGDGSVVVGLGWQGCDARAFRWSESTGMTALAQEGTASARANSISADGTHIGGWEEASGGLRRAVLWDERGDPTFVLRGEPGNAEGGGEVWGMTSDGSTFVGSATSSDPATSGPFVARRGEGVTYLGDIPGTSAFVSGANDISEDGRVIVGFQREGVGPFAAFDATIWTESTGTRRLSEYLADLGVAVPEDFQLAAVMGVSDDGTVLAGWGYTGFIFNQQAWVATIPGTSACPADLDGDGSVGASDLGALLGAWGACASCASDLDGDGAVGASDLGLLLGSWGACR
jgi:uncharacterized membrane protein